MKDYCLISPTPKAFLISLPFILIVCFLLFGLPCSQPWSHLFLTCLSFVLCKWFCPMNVIFCLSGRALHSTCPILSLIANYLQQSCLKLLPSPGVLVAMWWKLRQFLTIFPNTKSASLGEENSLDTITQTRGKWKWLSVCLLASSRTSTETRSFLARWACIVQRLGHPFAYSLLLSCLNLGF